MEYNTTMVDCRNVLYQEEIDKMGKSKGISFAVDQENGHSTPHVIGKGSHGHISQSEIASALFICMYQSNE